MKKLIFILAVIAAFTSCMKDGPNYKASYTLQDTCEYGQDSEIFPDNNDHYIFPEGFISYGNIAYLSKSSTETGFQGGFVLSRQAWKYPESSSEEDTEGGNEDNGTGEDTGEDTEETTPAQAPYGSYGEPGEGGAPAGNGLKSSKTFLYYMQSGSMSEHDIMFTASEVGTCAPVGIMVNNSANTVYTIKGANNDSFNLEAGQDLKLKITGYLNGTETGSVDVLLAGKDLGKTGGIDADGSAPDSLITSWTAIDLSDLGSIDVIDFEITGGGNIYPKDVCFDNFTANINIEY